MDKAKTPLREADTTSGWWSLGAIALLAIGTHLYAPPRKAEMHECKIGTWCPIETGWIKRVSKNLTFTLNSNGTLSATVRCDQSLSPRTETFSFKMGDEFAIAPHGCITGKPAEERTAIWSKELQDLPK